MACFFVFVFGGVFLCTARLQAEFEDKERLHCELCFMLEGLVCEFVELLREQSRFSSTLLPDLIGFG